MPSARQASRIVEPSGTSTGCRRRSARRCAAGLDRIIGSSIMPSPPSNTPSSARSADSIADDGGLAEAADRRVAHRLRRSRRAAPARPARVPRVRPRRSRASASSWRTVPTRHGTHWPQLLVAEERGDRASAVRGRSTVSSSTITTPEPSVVPALARVLEGQRQVELVGRRRTLPAAPPSSTARSVRPPRTPPASSSSSRSVVPNGTS